MSTRIIFVGIAFFSFWVYVKCNLMIRLNKSMVHQNVINLTRSLSKLKDMKLRRRYYCATWKNNTNLNLQREKEQPLSTMSNDNQMCSDCSCAFNNGYTRSGVYPVWLLSSYKFIYVHCDMDVVSNISSKRGWITIQRRLNGKINFYRNWKSYASGFGNPNAEYWLGLENIHLLTYQDITFFHVGYYDNSPHLRIDLKDKDGVTAYIEYSSFTLANKRNNYAIKYISLFGGTALTKGALPLARDDFSTFDRNNGPFDILNCGKKLQSGWWFYVCGDSNLNGPYPKQGDKNSQSNIYWYHWETINPNNTAFKKVSMKLMYRNT